MVKRPSDVVPERLTGKLRFSENGSYNTGALTYATRTIAMNNPYDPIYTIGGGSCTGYAEMMALYEKSLVTSCRVQVSSANGQTTYWRALFQCPVSSAVSSGGGLTWTYDQAFEGPLSSALNTLGLTMGQVSCIDRTYYPPAFEGLTTESAKVTMAGGLSTSPVLVPTVVVGQTSSNAADTGFAFQLNILVEYTVLYYRPKHILGVA